MTIYNVASRLWRHFIRPNGYFSFHEKLKSIQYNAALPITGAIRGSFKKKFIKNKALNSFSNDGGAGNFASFSK